MPKGLWGDIILCTLLVICCRGFESVIEDYVPQGLKKVSHVMLYCVSFATFAGLMYLNFADVGICTAVKMIWSL